MVVCGLAARTGLLAEYGKLADQHDRRDLTDLVPPHVIHAQTVGRRVFMERNQLMHSLYTVLLRRW